MTLQEWKSRRQFGVKLRCSFRHYAPNADEIVTIERVQLNAVAFDNDGGVGSIKLKPSQHAWMRFPKKDAIRFTEDGFELLKDDGSLISRYDWVVPGEGAQP
jgi:hypothetical protein